MATKYGSAGASPSLLLVSQPQCRSYAYGGAVFASESFRPIILLEHFAGFNVLATENDSKV
jgi:hypothetical protein